MDGKNQEHYLIYAEDVRKYFKVKDGGGWRTKDLKAVDRVNFG